MTPYNRNLIDTAGIAEMLGRNRRYVTNTLVKLPDFPDPVINLSQKTRLWNVQSVFDFLKKRSRKNNRLPLQSREKNATY